MGHQLPSIPRDFGFTDDHALLIQSARRFLQERFAAPKLRALYDDGLHDPALHREIAELGWLDGASLSYLDAALLCEESGRVLCPVPVAASIVATDLLARGGDGDTAASITRGELIAYAAAEGDSIVGAPRGLGLLLLPAEGTSWLSLRVDGAVVDHEKTVDRTRDGVRLDASTQRAGGAAFDGKLTQEEVLARSLTLLAAESCGAAEAALLMTRDYACERKQFGRPIGTYQAVSHPIVNTMIAIEHARSLTLAAAAAIDSGQAALTLARMAKAAASETLRDATDRGVQLHGGFGFTWDCDMHFYFRRSLHDYPLLGTPTEHRAALLATLLHA
jgi:alkylation response protein AidB-like acyl-CoA dehydrogenase